MDINKENKRCDVTNLNLEQSRSLMDLWKEFTDDSIPNTLALPDYVKEKRKT